MSTLVIDIAAVPDTDLGSKLYSLRDLAEEDVARVMYTKNREREQGEDLPLTQNRILSISCLLDDGETLKLVSLGDQRPSESILLEELKKIITEGNVSQVVAWYGNRFEFPLLNLRSMSHSLRSALPEATACIDLNAELTSGLPAKSATLHDVALLCGLPGHTGLSADGVWDRFLDNRFDEIQESSELNAVCCWLIYLDWCVLTGRIDQSMRSKQRALLKDILALPGKVHLSEFVQNWNP